MNNQYNGKDKVLELTSQGHSMQHKEGQEEKRIGEDVGLDKQFSVDLQYRK